MNGKMPNSRLAQLATNLVGKLPNSFYHLGNQIAIDLVLSAAAVIVAFNLRFDFQVRPNMLPVMWLLVIVLPMLRVASLVVFGAYKGIWRYFNMQDGMLLLISAVPASVLMAGARAMAAAHFWGASIPFTVVVIEFGVFLGLAVAVRVFRRAMYEMVGNRGGRLRAVIIGTDATLAGALRQVSSDSNFKIVALLAPEARLHGLKIGGHIVSDDPSALPRLLAGRAVDVVLIADTSMDCIGATVVTASEFGVDCRLLPSAANVIRGEVRVAAAPKPEMAFMERGALPKVDDAVVESFQGRVVLVTGAGGSIGSELCRQVSQLPIARLVMLDQDENSIFEIGNELRELSPNCKVSSLVGDIRDQARIREIFAKYEPRIVLHAAAYKHVPVMEENCAEAVLNNVTGTRILVDAALESCAERFLMISSDKAVNPSSVMGATKRVAEMLVQERAKITGTATRFACVRFGNVVGSRGSVVPIFLKQIAKGSPVTITDEEMTRYFMTIPEAVQLVLQASTLGDSGEIYMLDMGNPIKIKNLAKKLIEMSGLRPEVDIPINVVGIRPGEKLHEELWSADAVVSPTRFSRVFAVDANDVPKDFGHQLGNLEAVAQTRNDDHTAGLLFQMPIDFARAVKAAMVSN